MRGGETKPAARRSASPVIGKAILKLAQQLSSASTPEYVIAEPDVECAPDCCYENVTVFVKRHGGSRQTGWLLRETPRVFVEGSLHAVWRRDDGKLVDITPRKGTEAQILFLRDSNVKWEGEVIEPRRTLLHLQPCYCGTGLPFSKFVTEPARIDDVASLDRKSDHFASGGKPPSAA